VAAVRSTIWVPPPTLPSNSNGCGHGHDNTLVMSEPGHLDLRLYRGDSGRFTVRVQMPDGTPIDISTAGFDCDVRTDVGASLLTSLQVVPIGAADPYSVEVIITPADSIAIADGLALVGQLMGVWDLQMTYGTEVITILRGHVCCVDDVSWPVG